MYAFVGNEAANTQGMTITSDRSLDEALCTLTMTYNPDLGGPFMGFIGGSGNKAQYVQVPIGASGFLAAAIDVALDDPSNWRLDDEDAELARAFQQALQRVAGSEVGPGPDPDLSLMVCVDGVEHATVPLRDGDDHFNREAERGALDRAYEAKESNPDSVVSIVVAQQDAYEAALSRTCDSCKREEPFELTVGMRVRLRHDVDRYPHFIARQGMEGVVVTAGDEQDTQPYILAVRMDDVLPGAEEWQNEVHWVPSYGEKPSDDLEVIA